MKGLFSPAMKVDEITEWALFALFGKEVNERKLYSKPTLFDLMICSKNNVLEEMKLLRKETGAHCGITYATENWC